MTRPRRVLLLNPNTSPAATGMMLAVARPLLPIGWTLEGTQAASGAAMIVDESALATAAAEVLRIGRDPVADAIIVAAFGDPGVVALQAARSGPVVGIAEAALREAAQNGRRFGIATTTPGLVAAIAARVEQLGRTAQCTGIRVSDLAPLILAADPARQDEALFHAATACIEQDGAAAVIIGGGPLSASAARLRQRCAIPIIEPVPAAMRAVIAQLNA